MRLTINVKKKIDKIPEIFFGIRHDTMTLLSFKDLEDAIPNLRKTSKLLLSKTPICGPSLRIEVVKEQDDQETFILHGKYYVSAFTLLSASYSIDKYGTVKKLNLHVRGAYTWYRLNQDIVGAWVGQIIAKKFTAQIKRELVEKVWHPIRVAKWVEAGVALEDL